MNSLSDSCTGIGVVAGFAAVVLLREGPHVWESAAHWKIELLHILQEVSGICKTRNQLQGKVEQNQGQLPSRGVAHANIVRLDIAVRDAMLF